MGRIISYAILVLLCLSFCPQSAVAIPAYPFKVAVKTFNGKWVDIFMQGDEHHKFAFTTDNYTILNDSNGWWYATQMENGEVKKSSFRLVAKEDENSELKNFKQTCPEKLIPPANISNTFRRVVDKRQNVGNTPVVGERHALVILMQYQDVKFKCSKDAFDYLFNSLEYKDNGATGSVRDFYRFASQGQLDYISDIYGPFTSSYPMRFYGANDAMGNDANPMELCKEALQNLPEDLDLSLYDNDGDGIIDNVHIIYAGYGEEAGASSAAIWAHEYPHQLSANNGSGITVAGYSCSPELRGNTNANITNIGVICHELGHALGAMDYYDTNYGTGGEYLGTGQWDIMASGSWNNDGKTPPNFNPYVRSCVFGWNKQELLSPNMQVCLPKMELDNAEQTVIYRLETNDEDDYFLLENRQKVSFDEAIPGEGLLIYHVHPDIEKYTKSNTVNATHPQCLYPVCASGSFPSMKKYGNINTGECPFPGNANKSLFSASSSPAAIAWNGSAAKVSISNIRMDYTNGSILFSTDDSVINPDEPNVPEENIVYKESFEHGLSNGFTIKSITGKDVWKTYKKGNFVLNPSSIPVPTDGDCLLMLYIPKGVGISESEITSSFIDVSQNVINSIAFDVCCVSSSTSENPSLHFNVEGDNTTYSTFQMNDMDEKWTTIEIPLNVVGSKIRYSISASIETGGVFVDNIRLSGTNSTDINVVNENVQNNKVQIFTMDGRAIKSMSKTKLPQGLYIIKDNGKTKKIISR